MSSTLPLRAAILAALSAGVFLRFTGLERKLFWFDEVFTALRVHGYDEHEEVNPRLYTGKVVSVDEIQAFQHPSPGKTVLDTVRGLARKEPVETPAYFVLARWAANLLGSTVFATRVVSAAFGVLALLGMYWFAMELFRDRLTAALAAGLMSVSPMFIRYSQEARPYAMWVLFIALSGAALLRALRRNDTPSWTLYAVILTASLYTHLLTVVVLASFGVYVLMVPARKTRFALSSGAALVAFTPWLAVLFLKRSVAAAVMRYTTMPKSFGFMLTRWSLDFSHLFLQGPPQDNAMLAFAALPALALVVYAFYFLRRHAAREAWVLPALLAAIPVGGVLALDLILGGSRSIHPRYFFPAMTGVELAVAYLLAQKARISRSIWQPIGCALLLTGLVSSAGIVQAPTWESLGEVDLDMVRLFNASPGTLVVSDVPYGVIAPLSYRLHPDVRFLLTRDPARLSIPSGFRTIYVYQPGPALMRAMENRYGNALRLVYRKARWEQTVYSLYEWVPGVK